MKKHVTPIPDEVRKDWVRNLKQDPEFGGAELDRTIKSAQHVLDSYGTRALMGFIDGSGVGDNPDFIRFLARIDQDKKTGFGDDNLYF